MAPLMSPRINKVCELCGTDFSVVPHLATTRRFCSRRCAWSAPERAAGMSARMTANPNHARRGKPMPEHIKEAIRRANQGRIPWNKKPDVFITCLWCESVKQVEPNMAAQKFCSRNCRWSWQRADHADEKKCLDCGNTKPLEDFSPHPKGKYGRLSRCRSCLSSAAKLRRQENPRPRKKRPGRSPEDAKAHAREYQREHYAKNKTRKQELNREWKKNNPDRMADYNHRRRARKYAVAYEKIDASVVAERDNWICGLCCLPISSDLRFPDPGYRSIDHVVPLSRGGSHTYDNVQLAHLLCNNLKFVGS